ncbi:MAG: hypothetical protein HS117_04465 [Verrucomicrobiaceae bacterium]|jgi:hypothetical protein|nr:hypothetical protein [Verrucomicrobiaceae bacterium]
MKSRRTTRYRNALGLPAITVIIVVVASLALGGLGIVISKNRVRALGEEQRKVEEEIRLLRSEIVKLEQHREKVFTSARLQPRLTKAATMLKDLEEEHLLFLPSPPPSQAHDNTAAPVAEAVVPAAIPIARAAAQPGASR